MRVSGTVLVLTEGMRSFWIGSAVGLLACGAPPSGSGADSARASADGNEAAAEAKLEAVKSDPGALSAFLHDMPKGGDLHNHLSGAIYAERYLEWARADGLCIDASANLVPTAKCPTSQPIPEATDPAYARIVDAWSMQDFSPGAESGHDHFFSAFGKFGLVTKTHTGDMLADLAARAADEHTSYVEIMHSLSGSDAGKVADKVWAGHAAPSTADLDALHGAMVSSPDWASALANATTTIDDAEAKMRSTLGCDGAQAQGGCGVTLRWLFQVSRVVAPQDVFAQMTAAFEVAAREPRVVGLNLVAPEDSAVALRDYELQMAMLDYLRRALRDGQRGTARGACPKEGARRNLPDEQRRHPRRRERSAPARDVCDRRCAGGARQRRRRGGAL
jgi:hypothetical protein